MKIYDLHTHTCYSDGATDVEYLIEKAKEKGYDGVGISDHILYGGMDTDEDVKRYIREVGQKPVFLGGEFNIGEDFPDYIIDSLDYHIGSVHIIYKHDDEPEHLLLENFFCWKYGDIASWEGYDVSRAEEYLNRAYKQTEDFMSKYPMDILGHCKEMPFFEDIGVDNNIIKDWEKAIIGLCKKHNTAIEISGLWKCPEERMIKLAKSEHIKFSFGCDCHEVKDILDLDYSIKMAEKLGFTDEDLFIPVRKPR